MQYVLLAKIFSKILILARESLLYYRIESNLLIDTFKLTAFWHSSKKDFVMLKTPQAEIIK